MTNPPGQISSGVPGPEGEGQTVTVISAGREVEQEARSMLILVPGLFRLDVVPHDDTVQTMVRSLAAGERAELRIGGVGGGINAFSGPQDVSLPSSSRFGGEVVMVDEEGRERVVATFVVGAVCHLERGVTSFTAQAKLS